MSNFVIIEGEGRHAPLVINLDAISWVEILNYDGRRSAKVYGIGVGEEIIDLHMEKDVKVLLDAIRATQHSDLP
jgi:hypothetical protein